MESLDILVIGGVGVDTVVRVPALPLPQADSLMVPPSAHSSGTRGTASSAAPTPWECVRR